MKCLGPGVSWSEALFRETNASNPQKNYLRDNSHNNNQLMVNQIIFKEKHLYHYFNAWQSQDQLIKNYKTHRNHKTNWLPTGILLWVHEIRLTTIIDQVNK